MRDLQEGETSPGEVSVTLQRDDSIIVLKGVPTLVCDNCGEYYCQMK